MKKKTLQKQFKCDRCGADFMKKCALNSHIEVVLEGKKPFKCDFCNKEFSKKVEQKIHITTVHEGKRKQTTYQKNIQCWNVSFVVSLRI